MLDELERRIGAGLLWATRHMLATAGIVAFAVAVWAFIAGHTGAGVMLTVLAVALCGLDYAVTTYGSGVVRAKLEDAARASAKAAGKGASSTGGAVQKFAGEYPSAFAGIVCGILSLACFSFGWDAWAGGFLLASVVCLGAAGAGWEAAGAAMKAAVVFVGPFWVLGLGAAWFWGPFFQNGAKFGGFWLAGVCICTGFAFAIFTKVGHKGISLWFDHGKKVASDALALAVEHRKKAEAEKATAEAGLERARVLARSRRDGKGGEK